MALLPLTSVVTLLTELLKEEGVFAEETLFAGLELPVVLFVPRTASSLIEFVDITAAGLSIFFKTSLLGAG